MSEPAFVHIHAPAADAASDIMMRCPTCKMRRRFFAQHYAMYGWTVTCLTCGDRWSDGERHERPRERGWRPVAVAAAKATRDLCRQSGLPKRPS